MKILYVGDLWHGSTAAHRLNAMKEIGDCDAIDSTIRFNSKLIHLLHWVSVKVKYHWDITGVNTDILRSIQQTVYDVVWIDKGLHIYPSVLKRIKSEYPNSFLVSYSPDDMFNPANQSHWYLKSIPTYDLHVSTKSYNVRELKNTGARDVYFVDKSYAPEVHHKMELTDAEWAQWGCDVGFIGSWEEDRDRLIHHLADQGITVTVKGSAWKKRSAPHPHIAVLPSEYWGTDYAKVINATKINLCFLKKANRDLQTARSIEIPACGGFMLAERTLEHQRLFEEDKEAVFFSTKEELANKVKYYVHHDTDRRLIADAGYARCIRSGYTHADRLREVFAYLKSKQRVTGTTHIQG